MVPPQFGNQPPLPIVPGMVVPGQVTGLRGATTVTPAAGSQTTQPANPALQMIQGLLTAPNPRAVATGVGQSSGIGQQPLQAGGIGGVASKLESESIKIYNDRSKYNEWEFIYDPRTELTTVVPGGATPPAGMGTPVGPGVPTQPNPRQGGQQINPRRPGN
jgi:hypothetical protein